MQMHQDIEVFGRATSPIIDTSADQSIWIGQVPVPGIEFVEVTELVDDEVLHLDSPILQDSGVTEELPQLPELLKTRGQMKPFTDLQELDYAARRNTEAMGPTIAPTPKETTDPRRVCLQCGRDFFAGEKHCIDDGEALYPILTTRNWDDDDLVGRVFDGRYLIKKLIGRGGVGAVLEAWHAYLDRTVAIKVIHPQWFHMTGLRKRFLREARALAAASHENVVEVIDFRVMPDGLDYLVMELLEGQDLAAVLKEHNSLPVSEVTELGIQAAQALEHMHRLGFVHRDLKPSNLWIHQNSEGDRQLTLLDFGAAGVVRDCPPERCPPLTQLGEILGTVSYMAPEQCRGKAVDAKADIYSLSCVLWELLVGRKPHKGNTPLETMKKHLTDTIEAPSTQRADIGPELDDIIMRGLSKNPEDRWPSAEEMVEALRAIASESTGGWELAHSSMNTARRIASLCFQTTH